jgi:hypothetical protein
LLNLPAQVDSVGEGYQATPTWRTKAGRRADNLLHFQAKTAGSLTLKVHALSGSNRMRF